MRWIIILLIIGLILSVFGFWAFGELSRYEHSLPMGAEEKIEILGAGYYCIGILMLGLSLLIGGTLLMIEFFENHNSKKNIKL